MECFLEKGLCSGSMLVWRSVRDLGLRSLVSEGQFLLGAQVSGTQATPATPEHECRNQAGSKMELLEVPTSWGTHQDGLSDLIIPHWDP